MTRPLRLLAAGGTIGMAGAPGEAARPALDGAALAAAVPGLPPLEVETLHRKPGVHVTLEDALALARRARDAAAAGEGVVITHGTDTIEEAAYLCDLLHGAEAPIVVTGAIRPASATGADGPANMFDAAAVASSETAGDVGAVVVFGGEIHAARLVRKIDSTSPRAFGSPQGGPLGHVRDGRVTLHARPARGVALDPRALDSRVPIVPIVLGDDGSLLIAAAADADGLVVVTLGAGHAPPAALPALRDLAARLPVVATVRPERGSIMHGTYGFEGSERDLRAAGAIAAGLLSPAAARIKLLACLGAGADPVAAFAADDG